MTETIDITTFIDNNPLTKLSSDHNSKIVHKIRSKFTDEEQKLFVTNFYCYLNYNQKTDFVIPLNNIWKWLGYGRVEECKRVLVKNFKENQDYKIENFAPPICGAKTEPVKQPEKVDINQDYKIENFALEVAKAKTEPVKQPEKERRGGHNKEYITLTVNCFKKLCLKSRTEKADQIHDYYIELENLMNELVAEQAEELKNRLMILENKLIDKEKEVSVELTKIEESLITNSMDKKLVYLGLVEENIVKFGFSKGIEKRVLRDHKKEIGPQFTLKYTIFSDNHIDLEDLIKKECSRDGSILFGRRLSKKYNGKNQTELIQLDSNFTIEKLYEEILKLKDLCNNEIIRKLMEENKKLRSINYVSQVSKDKISKNEEEEEEDTSKEIRSILGIKCTTCREVSEPAKIGINKITGQYYSQCVDCRKKYSELKLAKNEETRNKREKELIEKQIKINEYRENILKSDVPVNCFKCKKQTLPIDMGINKITNQIYKTCMNCRGINKQNKEGQTECSKCHKSFEMEYNEISRTNYRTCQECRQKDKKNRETSKLSEMETIECIYCHKDKPTELNAKKDGYYKSCKECRESRKKYDHKKNQVHKETILAKKKEHYQEKRQEIRSKQKEYYDQNRDFILASKAKTIKE